MLAQKHADMFSQENNLMSDLPVSTLHKKLICVMLAHSPQTTLHQKIIYNFVWRIYLARPTMHKEIACGTNVGPWLRYNFYYLGR